MSRTTKFQSRKKIKEKGRQQRALNESSGFWLHGLLRFEGKRRSTLSMTAQKQLFDQLFHKYVLSVYYAAGLFIGLSRADMVSALKGLSV